MTRHRTGLVGILAAVAIFTVACTHDTTPDHGFAEDGITSSGPTGSGGTSNDDEYVENGHDGIGGYHEDGFGGGCGGPAEWEDDEYDPIPSVEKPQRVNLEGVDTVPGSPPPGSDVGSGGTGNAGDRNEHRNDEGTGTGGCGVDDDWCGVDDYD